MSLPQTSKTSPSLGEVHRSIPIPNGNFWRKMLAFAGPGYLVAVGYMDPGNWATDLFGGAKFGYTLLSVVVISSLMAILLQFLCVRLGVVTEQDLAQACRKYFSPRVNLCLWILCEVAIAACDLAEVLGSAIALQLLFGIPLAVSVCITALDVLVILLLQHHGFRYLEAMVITLISIIGICFSLEIIFSHPDIFAIGQGFVPQATILQNQEMLYVAIGILGATVMPHNLYLHSAIVQTRRWQRTDEKKHEAIKLATIDSTIALLMALFINGAILIVSAATFHSSGSQNVAEIQDAYQLFSPILGVKIASTLFAIALLAAGQNSTLTGTLAGQVVMEGFLHLSFVPWLRRLITRLLAILPALISILLLGEESATELLVLSQVILSLQLSFAVIPLVMFTSNPTIMGKFVNPRWLTRISWLVAIVIAASNAWLVWQTFIKVIIQQYI